MIGRNTSYINTKNKKNILNGYIAFWGYYKYNLKDIYELKTKRESIINDLLNTDNQKILYKKLQEKKSKKYFNHELIQQISISAYQYEIDYKFMGKKVDNDKNKNEKLIRLFDELYSINYHEEIKNYDLQNNKKIEYKKSNYNNTKDAIKLYMSFLEKLFTKNGYSKEYSSLAKSLDKGLIIEFKKGITGTMSIDLEKKLYIIKIGNNSYETLFHEFTHIINAYFKRIYYKNYDRKITYTNNFEGFANFVAYNLNDSIINGYSNNILNNLNMGELYFSRYIYGYKYLSIYGNSDTIHNYKIIQQLATEFSDPKLTEFFFKRFYKFFLPSQNEYFYPKEMVYYTGYRDILHQAKNISNDTTLENKIINRFLGNF